MALDGIVFQGPHADDRRLADMRVLRIDQSARNDQIIVPGIHLAAALLGPVFLGCLSGRKEGGDKALHRVCWPIVADPLPFGIQHKFDRGIEDGIGGLRPENFQDHVHRAARVNLKGLFRFRAAGEINAAGFSIFIDELIQIKVSPSPDHKFQEAHAPDGQAENAFHPHAGLHADFDADDDIERAPGILKFFEFREGCSGRPIGVHHDGDFREDGKRGGNICAQRSQGPLQGIAALQGGGKARAALAEDAPVIIAVLGILHLHKGEKTDVK